MEELECGSNPGAETAYSKLAPLTKLRYFGCHGDFTGENFAELAAWNELEFLRISSCKISDAGIRTIVKTFPRLKHLHLVAHRDSTITAAGVANLSEFKEIEMLTLHSIPVDRPALEAIARHSSLRSLALSGTPLQAPALAALQRARGLRRLGLNQCELGEGCLDALASLRGLEKLELPGITIEPEGLAELKLELPGTQISQ